MKYPAMVVEATEIRRNGEREQIWHGLWAAEIPHLTNILMAHSGADEPATRKAYLVDVLGLQVAFLREMHQESLQHCSLELRYCYTPERQRVHIYLLGKGVGANQQAALELARSLWEMVNATFPHHLYKLAPLLAATEQVGPSNGRRQPISGKLLLQNLLNFPAAPEQIQLAELRRAERHELVEGVAGNYVVYPLRGSVTTMNALFYLLVGLRQPLAVSVGLRPTELTEAERGVLAGVTAGFRELERRVDALVTSQKEFVSVIAGDLAVIYNAYRHELQTPYLFRLTVASDRPLPASLLAELGADLSQPLERETGQPSIPNRKATFLSPQDGPERQRAYYNFRFLEFGEWGARTVIPQYKELDRLRRLVGAESANAAFRIPLPEVSGLPGIDSRPPSVFEGLPESLRFAAEDEPTIPFGAFHLPLRLLNQHMMIAGTVGSGKSTSAIQLLYYLWKKHSIPFLVIEPVNARHNDYRSLGRLLRVPEELRIFTVGDEGTAPLRFNPFEVPPGVIVNAHIAGLLACFQAALPMGQESPLPALFREAMRNIYFALGWTEEMRGDGLRAVPTLLALRDELAWLIEQRYSVGAGRNRRLTETAQTLVGASVTRVNALIHSAAGRTLLAARSLPLAELFEKPTLIELRHLGSAEDKALMTGFLLLALNGYCDQNREVGGQRLNHLLLLEEAHNLMEETGEGEQESAKAAAVKFFTNMLAEVRKYGQGCVVVEQIPTLLAEGALKNTVTKLMHRLPGPDDIAAMGATMNFGERHQVRAASLRPQEGEAFFFTDGLNEATLVNIPYFAKDEPLDDAEVAAAMARFERRHPNIYGESLPLAGCQWCRAQCRMRATARQVAMKRHLCNAVANAFWQGPAYNARAMTAAVAQPVRQLLQAEGTPPMELADMTYCTLLHLQEQVPDLQEICNPAALRLLLDVVTAESSGRANPVVETNTAIKRE